MTKLKVGLLTAVVVGGVATPLVMQQQAQAKLHDQDQALRTNSDRLTELQGKNEWLSDALIRAESSPTPANEQFSEVLRLRGEVGRLEAAVRELRRGSTNEPMSREEALASMRQMYSDRVKRLKQLFAANPAQAVPELKYLTDRDWLGIVEYDHHRIDPDNNHAMSMARIKGQIHFAKAILTDALQQYGKNNNNKFPTDLSQLVPYFKSPVDEAVLRDWVILPTSSLAPVMRVDEDWVITQKAPVNPELDQRVLVGFQIFRLGDGANQWDSAP